MAKQAEVIVYSKDYCGYCVAAKNLFKAKGVNFKEIDITNAPDVAADLWKKVAPQRTVPQIFINGQSMGGFTDVKSLDDQGKLDSLLWL